ncbi:hypothetical protein [Shewanella algidipiscicola]|uniref:Uncharacterized protein n=1 Tax=Shewanella algidipiscicola TaxID=614070 RepID=A0ABQ4PMB5_9GAMM|nr:hypothetical protein [Shewanella algidipiscicola]GIU49368.1 hypothetical protein TUM4630_27850 [Shewanella algidipiscicola]
MQSTNVSLRKALLLAILAYQRNNFTEVYLTIAQHYIAGRTLVVLELNVSLIDLPTRNSV